jgi:hypothetical protein
MLHSWKVATTLSFHKLDFIVFPVHFATSLHVLAFETGAILF